MLTSIQKPVQSEIDLYANRCLASLLLLANSCSPLAQLILNRSLEID